MKQFSVVFERCPIYSKRTKSDAKCENSTILKVLHHKHNYPGGGVLGWSLTCLPNVSSDVSVSAILWVGQTNPQEGRHGETPSLTAPPGGIYLHNTVRGFKFSAECTWNTQHAIQWKETAIFDKAGKTKELKLELYTGLLDNE